MAPANDRKPTGKPVRGRPELGAEAVVPLDALAVVCPVVVEDDDEPLELPVELPELPELPVEAWVEWEGGGPASGSVYW